MVNTGTLFFALYGFTLFVCFVIFRRVRRGGPRVWKNSRIGLFLAALILCVYVVNRLWEFGYEGDVIKVFCVDGKITVNAVNETASPERLRELGWDATGWYWTDNTVVRGYYARLIPHVRRRPNSYDSFDIPLLWMFFTAIIPSCPAWLHRFLGTPPGCCSNCRYDLTGNVSGVCPECGEPILSDSDDRFR